MGIQISKSVKWFFLSFSFFLWAGCSTEKEEGTAAESVGRVERVRLSFEGKSSDSEDSKVSFSEDKGSFSWQGGESIRVQLSGGTAADGTVDAAGSSSTMTVTVPSGQSRTGFAYYPASIVSTTASSRSLTVTLPDAYDSYAYPYAPTPMIAEQTTESGVSVLDNLRFLHLGGVALLEVKVASDVTANITKIVVAVDKRITGDFTATGSFGGYSIKTDGSASGTSVTYNLASPVAPGGSQKLFLPLPVGSYTIKYVLAYNASGNQIAKSSASTSSFNITRKGGKRFIDSNAIALAKATPQAYSVYELVYGTGNCIVDSGTASNRSVSFDATPYEAGTGTDNLYTYTSTVATPVAAKAPVSAKVLWYESLSSAPSASLNTSTYQVTVSGISGTGNCVVGLYNSSNKIIWSFHIWSPGWNPTTTNTRAYTGTDSKSYTVMGAALGATASSTAKETTWSYTHCGMYYQWGRKDPLGRVNSSKALSGTAVQSGIVPSTSNKIAANSSTIGTATSVADHIAYSIKNPHMFITNGENSYAWFSTYTTYTETNAKWDNHLWGTLYNGSAYTEIGKTIFDPCPAGWKVATTGVVFGKTTGSSAGSGTSSAGFQHTSPNDYFVYSGFRDGSYGTLGGVASYGYYWSSCQYSSSGGYVQGLYTYGTSGFNPTNSNNRALGLTVRCVRLQN